MKDPDGRFTIRARKDKAGGYTFTVDFASLSSKVKDKVGSYSAGKILKKGNIATQAASKSYEAAENFAYGAPVSYEEPELYSMDYFVKKIKNYLYDDDFADAVTGEEYAEDLISRLVSGDATEGDVKTFLGAIKDMDEYEEMGYSDPKKFISDVKRSADKGLFGRVSDRNREGTGVPEGKRSLLDTIHERNARNYKAMEETK